MSKTSFKKRKNDFYDDEEEYGAKPKMREDKRKLKRVDRAIKTKDIAYLMEPDDVGIDPEEDDYYQEYLKDADV